MNVMDIFRCSRLYSRDIIGSVQINENQRVEYSVRYGDVLFNRTSETLDEIAMASVYLDKKEIIFGGFVIRGRQKTYALTPEYSAYCLQSHLVRRELIRRGQGVVRSNIGQKDLSNVPVVIPPLNEQKSIASLLEKWDTAIEKTEALIAVKEKQFKWLLKTLISDRQDNPEWRKVKLGEFGTFYKGKGITKSDLVEYGIPCLRYAEIYTKYDILVDELSSSVNPNAAAKATMIQSGDIIFAASGETAAEIGKAIAFVGRYSAVAGGDTIIFRNHGQEPAFLAHMLNSANVARQKARLGKGQSVVHIHISELFQVEVPLPPLHEQRKIAQILASWDTAVEKTKALANQYRTQKRGLMQKLLTGKWRI